MPSEQLPQNHDWATNVRVDEVIPHIPGVNSHEDDVPYIDPDSPNIVKDEATAYDIAVAEDPLRTSAADKRQLVSAVENHDPHSGGPTLSEQVEGSPALQRAIEGMGEVRGRDTIYHADRGDLKRYVNDEMSALKRAAAERDVKARRIGDWAEILSKQRPSDDYLREVIKWNDVTPEALVDSEDYFTEQEARAERWESKPAELMRRHSDREKEYASLVEKHGRNLNRDVDQRFSLVGALAEELLDTVPPNSTNRDQLLKVLNSDETTLKDMKDLYQKECERVATYIREGIENGQRILSEIKSGEAANYRSQASESSQQSEAATA